MCMDPDYVDPGVFATTHAGARVILKDDVKWNGPATEESYSSGTVQGWVDAGPFGRHVLVRFGDGLPQAMASVDGHHGPAEFYHRAGTVTWTRNPPQVDGYLYHALPSELVLFTAGADLGKQRCLDCGSVWDQDDTDSMQGTCRCGGRLV